MYHIQEDVPKEWSCVGECFRKSKYPGVYIKKGCQDFISHIKQVIIQSQLQNETKEKIESNPQDENKELHGVPYYDFTPVLGLLIDIHKLHSYLEECTYANQFVKNMDYGKKYTKFREENSELVNKILSINIENIDEIIKNPHNFDLRICMN